MMKPTSSFPAFYDNTVIRGIKGAGATAELDLLLDMIFRREGVSRFMPQTLSLLRLSPNRCGHRAARNAAPGRPLPAPELRDQTRVEALLTSQHFFDPVNYGRMIQSPVDSPLASAGNSMSRFPDPNEYVDLYGFWERSEKPGRGIATKHAVTHPTSPAGSTITSSPNTTNSGLASIRSPNATSSRTGCWAAVWAARTEGSSSTRLRSRYLARCG